MGRKIKVGDKEYDVDKLSDQAKAQIASLSFAQNRIQELTNLQAFLQRAKQSYIESLKQEMLSSKSGILFEDN